MAEIEWKTRKLRDNMVRLFGEKRLDCGHKVADSARVRNRPADIEQGKRTVAGLIKSLENDHVRKCTK